MDTGLVLALALLVPAIVLARWRHRIRSLPIAELELAFTPAKVDRLLAKWNANDKVRKSIYVDYLFIPCYTGFFWFLCRWVDTPIGAQAALAAGALDAFVENPVLLLELGGQSNAFFTFMKAVASLIKWIVLLALVVYFVYLMDQA